jgi:hypothetical protein
MIDDLKDKEKWWNENYPVIRPLMEKAFWRLFLNPLAPWAESCPDEILRTIFAPPADYKEAMLTHVTDFLTFITFDERATLKMVNSTVSKALPEIKEAYNVILKDGGGWSYRRGGPSQRQTAVLAWFNRNKDRLSYLKKSYLEDPTLYNDGGGQEKRNFTIRLLMLIIKQNITQKITSQKIQKSLNNLKNAQQKSWLSQALALTE